VYEEEVYEEYQQPYVQQEPQYEEVYEPEYNQYEEDIEPTETDFEDEADLDEGTVAGNYQAKAQYSYKPKASTYVAR
jgi:hypothetical protein